MSYEYLGYSSPHYILDRNNEDNNKVEYYYLMSDEGKDVHRISSNCVKNVSAGLVPCNVMSGAYHGTDSDDYWSRVHAPIADGSCAPVKTDCTGYDGDTQEHGFQVDGSVYSDDKGVTVGEKAEPTDNNYLFINKYGSDINIPNTIIGAPPNLSNNKKYKNLTLFKTYADNQERDFSINNPNDAIINSQGRLDVNIYVSRGRLSIDWDHFADTYDIYDGADQPCSPEGGDASYLTWNHECNICNARADFAKRTSETPIIRAFDCYNELLPDGCSYWGEEACHEDYGCSYYDEGYGHGDWDYGHECGYYYVDAKHPCGEEWEEDLEGMLEAELYRIHSDSEFVACRTTGCAIARYKSMCFNDCNEGTTLFEEGHPRGASCKDINYDNDGGRWSDLHHLCGLTDSNKSLRTPLNKSS